MKYDELKQKYKDYIIIQKQGLFYVVYGEDTYILNYIFDYQIKTFHTRLKLGFPNIDKVTNVLNKLKINYIVANETKKKFKDNNYHNYNIENIKRMNKILLKIKSIINDENKIKILEQIV